MLPHIASHADEIAVVRSMFTEHRNHEQALWMMHTGLIVAGRPTLGAWVAYGLGTENQNLPAYVVLPDPTGLPVDGIRNWSSGWLPPLYQGTPFRSEGHAGLNLKPQRPAPAEVEQGRLDLLAALNAEHRRSRPGELELDARIASYELAGADAARRRPTRWTWRRSRRRSASSTASTTRSTRSYGLRCLMARRLVERGVRVRAALHGRPAVGHAQQQRGRAPAAAASRPTGRSPALLTDLKQRGLLDATLVFWGGEFGRTPGAQGTRRPRPPPVRLQRLAGRRRHQGRPGLRRDRRLRLPRRDGPHAAWPTCTPRCCTCSAWTTAS